MIEKKIKILLVMLGITLTVSFVSSFETASFADADKDSIVDSVDNCPNNANFTQEDYDFDKLGDLCDPDDDNDGIIDALDFFDTDYKDWADFDYDGLGSAKDPDDDNDGILDNDDAIPILSSESLTTKYMQNIQDCAIMDDGSSRLLCYSHFFGDLTKNEKNNSAALELSIALSKLGAIDDCHFVSHEVGHAAFNERPNVIENLIGMDGTMCRGGYFHGVLAAYFHDVQEKNKSLPSDYKVICNELIGSSNYQDCVHGLGHGFVHYFGDDLTSSLEMCNDMSFYQNRVCVKGVMMQYTDNILTRQGVTKDTISNLCNEYELSSVDFVECSMSVGTTLAFFTDHDMDKGSMSCNLIEQKQGQDYCLEGLRLEIQDSDQYDVKPLTEDIREKFQPQFIEGSSKTIDIRSPAVVSDFQFLPEDDMILFSIDRPQYVIMYIPNEFVTSNMLVAVNFQIPRDLSIQNNVLGEDVVMIRFVPNHAGQVMISSLPQ